MSTVFSKSDFLKMVEGRVNISVERITGPRHLTGRIYYIQLSTETPDGIKDKTFVGTSRTVSGADDKVGRINVWIRQLTKPAVKNGLITVVSDCTACGNSFTQEVVPGKKPRRTCNNACARERQLVGVHITSDDPGKAACLMKCGRIRLYRGLCKGCYTKLRDRIVRGETTWEEAEKAGECDSQARGQDGRKPFARRTQATTTHDDDESVSCATDETWDEELEC